MKCEEKHYYIAYFDILGYKAYFEDKENDIISFLHSIIEISRDFIKSTTPNQVFCDKFITKTFSDNFIIMIEENGYDDYQNVKSLAYIIAILQLRFLEKYNILIRGSITKGKGYIDNNIVFGEGLIRSVQLEEKASFPRVIIDYELFGKTLCDDLCEKCIMKDSDDRYFVDFLSIIGVGIGNNEEYMDDEESHMMVLHKNIISLIKKYGKFDRKLKDDRKLLQNEKIISKYLWLLEYYNKYCSIYYPEYIINYNLKPYAKIMKSEIVLLVK